MIHFYGCSMDVMAKEDGDRRHFGGRTDKEIFDFEMQKMHKF